MSILITHDAFVDVHVDDYKQGEMDYVNTWNVEHLQGVYKDIQELVKRIHELTCCFSDNVKDYQFIDGIITTSELVDNYNCKASKRQLEQWEQGKETLYCADFNLHLQYCADVHDMTESEASAMGIEIY